MFPANKDINVSFDANATASIRPRDEILLKKHEIWIRRPGMGVIRPFEKGGPVIVSFMTPESFLDDHLPALAMGPLESKAVYEGA